MAILEKKTLTIMTLPSTAYGSAFATPSPPEWLLEALGGVTGKQVKVGVIDSGWNRSIEEVRVRPGCGFTGHDASMVLQASADDHDQIGHGTACADLILHVAPAAEIYPVRVFGSRLETSVDVIAAGLRWCVEQELRLVNLSLGTVRSDILYPFYKVCEFARRQGLLIVSAVRDQATGSFPAIFENVIGVGAGTFDTPFDYVYRPEEAIECLAKSNDLVVRGEGGYPRSLPRATSYAAPVITGLIALIVERYPHFSLADVRQWLAQYSIITRVPPAVHQQSHSG